MLKTRNNLAKNILRIKYKPQVKLQTCHEWAIEEDKSIILFDKDFDNQGPGVELN